MKFIYIFIAPIFFTLGGLTQKVGIGTNSPMALLHVKDSSVLFSGMQQFVGGFAKPPVSGSGMRTLWYSEKAAFRTGGVGNTSIIGLSGDDDSNLNNWDKDSIGLFSFGAGFNTKSKGDFSCAIGYHSFANGNSSAAFGRNNAANGNFSVSFGSNNKAEGEASTAIGNYTLATGRYSLTTGEYTTSSGIGATAMGGNTEASGKYSTALGGSTIASGNYSTSLGDNTIASGDFSTAMGEYATAGGDYSTAIGKSTKASGYNSLAAGSSTTASGSNSTAFGEATIASGDNSTAMGHNANTNSRRNSFCIAGAPDDAAAFNTSDNQMMMRFNNYTFWVSASNYAYLIPASNGWAYTSDKNKKENFKELNGENVLSKIASIPFYSWNFKAKDTRQYRHYGIMAQDFFQAFGKDEYGVIGNDTTVSPLDLLGVAYSAIKALEKRTENLQAQSQQMVEALQKQIGQLLIRNKQNEEEIVQLKEIIGLKKTLTKRK